jgi:transcriptional regulator with XRE-family HTH domain
MEERTVDTFGHAIRKLLSESNLSQQQLANRLRKAGFESASPPRVSEWINGHKPLKDIEIVNEIIKIIKATGTSVDEKRLLHLWKASLDEPRKPPHESVSSRSAAFSPALGFKYVRFRILLAALLLAVLALAVLLNLKMRPDERSPQGSARTALMYAMDADRTKGAHVHEIPPGSAVDQSFPATMPRVLRLAVIVGREGHPDGAEIGKIDLQLLGCSRMPINWTREARNNIDTLVEPGSPVDVEVGKTCTLRVTNRARITLGFWFNQNASPQYGTILHGAIDPPGDPVPHGHALSGHVLGQG